MNCEKLSLNERLNILKMILYFDESGLKLSDIAGTMEIPKADVRKDLEIMSEELKKDGIKLIYENYKGYKLTGNKGDLLVKRLEIIEDIIRELKETGDFFNSGDSGTWHSEEYFYGYIKYENLEITRDFLELIGKELELEIHQENYNRVFSYILMLINFEELYDNKEELLTRNFLFHTPEYLAVERILGKLFKENDRKESPKKAKLLLITDLIMGINISGLKDDIFYKWINEEAVTEGIIDKVSDMINLNLREDKILITGFIDNLKFSIYRIKNDIQIINSVFKDLILNKDKNIEIVKKAVEEPTYTEGVHYDSIVFGKEEESLDYTFSKCCNPIPGDPIFGFVTINEGVKVHKKTCPNAISMQSNYAYRVIPAKWVKSDERDFKVSLRISGIDRDGLISDISKVILDSKFVKLTNINIDTEGNVFNGKVSISINNNATLKKLMLDIKNVKGVDKVTRL